MMKKLKMANTITQRVVYILLLNFLFSTVHVVAAQKICNGICFTNITLQNGMNIKENNCCRNMNKIKPLNLTSPKNKKEFSKNKCDYNIIFNTGFTFIIPKTDKFKIVLTKIKITNLSLKQKQHQIYIGIKNSIFFDTTPPIFIIVSSFLI